ncbi:SymE family type I addiction module toxin [Xenorhabdus szentirmaii]|uniref:Complete genome segment 13/17 n=1 Tax=Xenorhabdus szentirmaii DSM 16338 TaxID=1427518 RepID=W1J700_9GAMM|nr:SymE family type I addiction module toxin [Xenorhabdus szentirmaii]PHM35535.1 endoribonuclease symE [Xenorhabdus szentirmaii DSM 16338]PHM44356.1 endoribonuclease symE [Xenorhabdus szentirmaii]CDL85641.1 Complete genome; segment 13/17 [Xenorhabdus szentirmaii DSM 16338]
MANRDCNVNSNSSKAQRRYKIGYISTRHADRHTGMTRHYSQSPSLHLKGNWLEEAGFATGQAVKVSIEQGQLIIQLVEKD